MSEDRQLSAPPSLTEQEIVARLEQRLDPVHARQRLGIESDHERVFGQGLNFFHPENSLAIQLGIRSVLMLTGLYWRGQRNAEDIQLRHNIVSSPDLPANFDGFTILQLTDFHADMNVRVMQRLTEMLPGIQYDLCVLTGDYRGLTYGPFAASLSSVAEVCSQLKGVVYGVLGNHDTIRMVPGLEDAGVRLLLNESDTISRGQQRIHIVGVDDAHYYRADNIEKAAAGIPPGEFSILLSHTPEIYRHAAHAGFQLMLSGHTHGGQICLPGSIPLTLDSVLPRRFGAGAWTYHSMAGYTSVGVGSSLVPVRFNCPPEITLHHLRCAPTPPSTKVKAE